MSDFSDLNIDAFTGGNHIFSKKESLAHFNDFSCLIITGTCLAAEPSRSATFLSIDKAKSANIPIVLDIDYRPYTWTSPKEASEVYRKASKNCDILIGNDDEFGILSNNYEKGMKTAQNLAQYVSVVIYKKGESFYSFFTSNKKFSKSYNFKFTDNLSTIIDSFNKK